MRLFLQINVAQWSEQPYDKPLLSLASSLSDDVVGTDLDCESDPYVVGLVKKLVSEATSVFLFVQAVDPTMPLRTILPILNDVLDQQEKIHLSVLSGAHSNMEKLLRVLGDKFVINDDVQIIQKLIRQFAIG